MAANCGMDYAFMTEFMHAILHRESQLLRYTCCTKYPHHAAVLVCFCYRLDGGLLRKVLWCYNLPRHSDIIDCHMKSAGHHSSVCSCAQLMPDQHCIETLPIARLVGILSLCFACEPQDNLVICGMDFTKLLLVVVNADYTMQALKPGHRGDSQL